MLGTVVISSSVRWTAAGWLFDLTLRFLAEEIADPAARSGLKEVIDENLAWFELDSLPDAARTSALRALRDKLVNAADAQLPKTLAEREAVLAHLCELSELAGASSLLGKQQ